MTTNGNGHYDLAGTELADDGLDLVQKLESHLSIHPEDSETRGALQQLFAAPVVKPIRLWDWTMAPEAKPMEWLVENWLPAGRVSMLTGNEDETLILEDEIIKAWKPVTNRKGTKRED